MPATPTKKTAAVPEQAYTHGHHHHSSADARYASPLELFRGLAVNRHLITQFTRRDLLGRYRGSYLGVFWSFLNPLLLLTIFTVVFGVIFKGRLLEHRAEGPADFALAMFAGLIVFNTFAECITRAPNLIMVNANYVTKIVFPLEILPVTTVLASLMHMFISLFPLWIGVLLLDRHLPWTAFLWPVLLVPLCAFNLGIVWLLSALGVFLRDLNEIVIALTQILLYASAIFYPIDHDRLGAFYPLVRYNPVAFLVEQSRLLAVYGDPLNLQGYAWTTAGSLLFMLAGYAVFMRAKHAFADVI